MGVIEERSVGAAHHRKTRSRCSIDWTLPPTDMLLEKDQQIEQLNRTKLGAATSPVMPFSPPGSFPDDASSDDDTGNDSSVDGGSVGEKKPDTSLWEGDASGEKVHPLKRQGSASKETKGINKAIEAITLPDFADRLSCMKNDGNAKRWWPYAY